MTRRRRVPGLTTAVAFVATVGVLVTGTGPAAAVGLTPPTIAAGGAPSGPTGPTEKTKRATLCVEPRLAPGTDLARVDPTGHAIDFRAAWPFSTGKGQVVAVIDTGVSPHPRLRGRLRGGGDFVVAGGSGLDDCDAHGTLVAGLIAARPSVTDGFSGIAPDATILSIRQNTTTYVADTRGGGNGASDFAPKGYGSTTTLAYAITSAVRQGATVINISAASCGTSSSKVEDELVGRAVRAAYRANVVVVVAAGNVDEKGGCRQNPALDPNLPRESSWPKLTTYASPAWFSDYVLAVGSLSVDADPLDSSLRGPWVSVAAPGENMVSLNNATTGLTNEQPGDGQTPWTAFNGTSFAAAIVSGTVALIRARYPRMTAREVMDVVKRTAHTSGRGPDLETGYGIIDPVAALALDPARPVPAPTAREIAGPAVPDPAEHRARDIALIVGGISVFLIAAAWALFTPLRRRRDTATDYRDIDEDS
ncbi:type VII secretion-associated serine protease mycosin [Gordonia sp. ABSL1-1]|uniref:type VII secretion-associated serine protease mycosin n=1 Tax=Gordonia sp. ABSL1-1 TaxID=3053923 RepID=UPI002573BAAD|nr:type VII secretion-associated serine protease mycosin [Gordonia sp. ABSL1-1]MDL9937765.1 type VII secretion-associated serine protease mycosin [Gordonia sp. ABSL1-1]